MRNRVRFAIALLTTTVMLAALLAAPAAADHPISTLLVFRGRAAVSPMGLPAIHSGQNGSWALSSAWATSAGPSFCVALGPPAVDLNCAIDASGLLASSVPGSPIVGDGGYCALSQGQGSGFVHTVWGGYGLNPLSWITSAGTVLPVFGPWVSDHGAGVFVALLKMSGGNDQGTPMPLACFEGTANAFDVNGIVHFFGAQAGAAAGYLWQGAS